ncbi:NfeD family protein [Aurantiacibacter sp. MUD11]|uniref:NfeD family protein n=1 Tax=Aurantiacibacter sp. MUD11 TaxID=3003265 RepID=UPI0022AAAAFA|nr:NfeD family protein [Aurantiacibacter sp. MUD11]WAT16844.1 NfeD family protein [Aurantiacibacter sp. MUD11]
MDFLDGIETYWLWLTLGLVLAALEMLVPGVYLIWLAMAALVTGLLVFVNEPSVALQFVSFVGLSLIFAFSARRWLRDSPIESSDPLINRKGARLVGETALVTHAIEHGSGRVKLGDSEWIARGPDMAAGERVRVTGTDGAILLVEPLALPEGTPPAQA